MEMTYFWWRPHWNRLHIWVSVNRTIHLFGIALIFIREVNMEWLVFQPIHIYIKIIHNISFGLILFCFLFITRGWQLPLAPIFLQVTIQFLFSCQCPVCWKGTVWLLHQVGKSQNKERLLAKQVLGICFFQCLSKFLPLGGGWSSSPAKVGILGQGMCLTKPTFASQKDKYAQTPFLIEEQWRIQAPLLVLKTNKSCKSWSHFPPLPLPTQPVPAHLHLSKGMFVQEAVRNACVLTRYRRQKTLFLCTALISLF